MLARMLRRTLRNCCGLLTRGCTVVLQPSPMRHTCQRSKEFFPGAERLQALEGEPRASGIHGADRLLGYAFLTDQVAPIPAYSGRPISTLVAFDLAGVIRGARIVEHQEPILVVGITEQDLARYIQQYVGKRVDEAVKIGGGERDGYRTIDGISGATITVMVLNRAIMVAAKKVAVAHAPARRENEEQGASTSASPAPAVALEEEPIWLQAWEQKTFRTGLLIAGLIVLGLILTFQDWLAGRPRLLRYLRYGYLVFTLFYIGWYSLAQLSIVNVLTFLSALMHGFQWDTFLIDPMLFVLWSFVAVTIILWGRGVYCGWLCPFGALQELAFQLAKKLRVPSWEFPQVVHDRLVAIKYIVVILLFGASMGSLELAVRYAEIEPFKTAITLRFMREWWYVGFAVALVLVSCVIRKFFIAAICAR